MPNTSQILIQQRPFFKLVLDEWCDRTQQQKTSALSTEVHRRSTNDDWKDTEAQKS